MKKLLIGLSALLVLLFTGCATSYQPDALTGGYNEMQLDENVFKVSFRGNAYVSKEKAVNYALLRAGEVTLLHGYKYFVIVDAQSYSKIGTHTSPTTYRTYGNTTYSSGGGISTTSKPTTTNTIKCFKTKPNTNAMVYNAEFLVKAIKEQYKIK